MKARIFLLSPASTAGARARQITSDSAAFDLAVRLRGEGAPLGEVFRFMSGLYFRGKLAYAEAFAEPSAGVPGVLVITAAGGLVPPHTPITLEHIRQYAAVPIDAAESRYRAPLDRDARRLARLAGEECEIVLLGSIAESKYVRPLAEIFGARLVFPAEFVGRGDLSRGGLMLRCVREGTELSYVSASSSVRRGTRPPKLGAPSA